MSLSDRLFASPAVAVPLRSESRPWGEGALSSVASLAARAIGQPLPLSAFAPLPASETPSVLWRVRLQTPLKPGIGSVVAKISGSGKREPELLRWLEARGRLAPRLYQEVELSDQLRLVLLEDLGDSTLPDGWWLQPRLLDGIVDWFSRIARITLPDPVPAAWVDFSRPGTLTAAFERGWMALQDALAAIPGLVESGDIAVLNAVFGRRAMIAQRLGAVSRRLIHGNLQPAHIRPTDEHSGQIRAVNWESGGCGPLAFDLYDLVWSLPDPLFERTLGNLVCLMPFDLRPDLTPPVLRLAGVAKAFLNVTQAVEASRQVATPTSREHRQDQVRIALDRLKGWHDQGPVH